ncbi:MAG: hypothetical protein WBN04_19610 [Paracoccaceae bacterium]
MTAPSQTSEEIEAEAQADRARRCYPLNTDSPHVAYLLETDERVRFYLVDMSGLAEAAVAALLPVVRAEMERRRVVPVFVTDLTDYRVLREAGVIFESLPPADESATLLPDCDWQARRRAIMGLIRDKWAPSGETDFGTGSATGPMRP